MRLICPNCDARYEVDASLIPSSGRDVQCSNCGKTWFQEPVETLRLTAEDEVVEAPAAEETVAAQDQIEEPVEEGRSGDGLGSEAREFFSQTDSSSVTDALIDEDEPGFEPSEAAAAGPDAAPDYAEDVHEAVEEVAASGEDGPLDYVPPAPEPVHDYSEPVHDYDDGELAVAEAPVETELERPEVDSAVLGILKAEAEREIAARRAEEAGVETQPDLGLSEPEPEAERDRSEIEARTARLRGDDEETASIEDAVRRTVLPDVDEINSTLTATTERAAATDAAAAAVHVAAEETMRKRRVGFRLGFSMMIMAATALILLYLYAPQIAEALPEATPALTAYVDWANGIRQSVDVLLNDGVDRLTTILVSLTT